MGTAGGLCVDWGVVLLGSSPKMVGMTTVPNNSMQVVAVRCLGTDISTEDGQQDNFMLPAAEFPT